MNKRLARFLCSELAQEPELLRVLLNQAAHSLTKLTDKTALEHRALRLARMHSQALAGPEGSEKNLGIVIPANFQ